MGDYIADLCVENAVIVGLKAAAALDRSHEAQLMNYLRATGMEVGLLLNFGPKPEFVRRIYTPHAVTANERAHGGMKQADQQRSSGSTQIDSVERG